MLKEKRKVLKNLNLFNYIHLEEMLDSMYDVPHPGQGKWASAIRVLDVVHNKVYCFRFYKYWRNFQTVDLLELSNNETAVCLCLCSFQNRESELFLCVGTAKDLKWEPQKSCTDCISSSKININSLGFIHVYRLIENGTKLELVHSTSIGNSIPGAMAPFQGRLVVGAGPFLRIYDIGKTKVLRKCEMKVQHL